MRTIIIGIIIIILLLMSRPTGLRGLGGNARTVSVDGWKTKDQ